MQATARTNKSQFFSADDTENNSFEITIGNQCEVRGISREGGGLKQKPEKWSTAQYCTQHWKSIGLVIMSESSGYIRRTVDTAWEEMLHWNSSSILHKSQQMWAMCTTRHSQISKSFLQKWMWEMLENNFYVVPKILLLHPFYRWRKLRQRF